MHKGILKKFEYLKGQLIIGKKEIKGENSTDRLPPDSFVPEKHILHDLIRGFYKPAGKPYLLSYQATESENNYGKQIIWKNENNAEFIRIEMAPPNSPKDNRKKSDIDAARYNLINKIPIGILRKVKKGHNIILGLGRITSEREDGIFIIEPFSYNELKKENLKRFEEILEELDEVEAINTSVLREVFQRQGQQQFKRTLLERSNKCALCEIEEPFLIASHIKPWNKCTDEERLNSNNGLLLCPNHDILFDRGYITFNEHGLIKISPKMPEIIKHQMGLKESATISINLKMNEYMKWHRLYQFKK
ncbi:HNH endonuclease [Bacillus dakarensis]|uniref:HNH endonuclease n=1 Tax=Robertmurraya dakarensis TaxID=1926278 RepID=UPI001F28C6F9|nr:HNH endonuclease [Bacillus dakarensis]